MKHRSKVTLWFSLVAAGYILLNLVLPPSTATIRQYHLSFSEYRVLALIIGIPTVAAWFAAFYGYTKLETYASTIKKSADGKAFMEISRGLKYLAWGLPASGIMSSVLGGIAHASHGFASSAIIINHYTLLLISLVAFSVMSNGSRKLVDATGKRAPIMAIRWLFAGFVLLSSSFCFATIRNIQNQTVNPYRLPTWLILLTIVMPYLYAWLMGLFAAYEISLYRKHVQGILYQRGLNLLAGGTTILVLASVGVQYLTSGSPYLRRISLSGVALLFYTALLMYAVGFVLVASGADKLKKIEDI